MIECAVQPSTISFNSALDACSKAGQAKEAQHIMEKMQGLQLVPDVFSFTSLIKAYGQSERLSEARSVLEEMWSKKVVPNQFTYASLIYACKRCQEDQMAAELQAEMKQRQLGSTKQPRPVRSSQPKTFNVAKEHEKRSCSLDGCGWPFLLAAVDVLFMFLDSESFTQASQLWVRAYFRKAAIIEQETTSEQNEADEHAQYSSALSFFQTVKVLKPYFWPTTGKPVEVFMNRIRALTTWICVVLSKVCNIISPIYLARATNALSSALRESSPEINAEIWWPLVEYAALSLVYIKVQQAAYIEIADNTFAHLHGLSLDWHLRKKMGNVVRSMDRGIQAAQQTMQYVVLYLIPTLVEALAVTLIFVFHFENVQLAVFVILNLTAYMYATIKITLWRKKFRTATTKHDNDLHDRLTDSLVNYEARDTASIKLIQIPSWQTVKYFTAENYERREYRSLVESFQKTSMATQASLSLLNILQQLIVNFTLCGGMILATLRVLETSGNLGDFVAVNTYIINVFTPLNFLGTIYNMVVNAIVDMKSFGQLLAETSEVQDMPGAPDLDLSVRNVAMVAFEKVCFHYSKQPLGRAIKDGWFEDVVLFNSTITHNLKYGNVDKATDQDIQRAAETIVGERGLKLSGGEKQRLAIARCLVKDPPIVVLDEATSALDSETEQKIQQALNILSASRTVIAIAHRLSTIKNYDEICVLQSGEIVERGNHEALLSSGSSYSGIRMTKQLGTLTAQVEEQRKSHTQSTWSMGGLISGKQQEAIQKAENDLAVLRDELMMKIQENEDSELHMRVFEAQKQHNEEAERLRDTEASRGRDLERYAAQLKSSREEVDHLGIENKKMVERIDTLDMTLVLDIIF
eukprot:g17793.t1